MDWTTVLMLVAVVAAFYFLMIRPQQKRAKEQKEKMASLTEGARIMTIHGIFGNIIHLGERQAIVEISPGVEMTILKQAISTQPVEDEFEYEDDGESEDIEVREPTDDEVEALLAEQSEPLEETTDEPTADADEEEDEK
jgi:preprotein translocase subunit YajC